MFKKEYLYVSLLITLVIAVAVFIGSRSPEIDTVYPEERLQLQAQDFAISTDNGQLIAGITSWEEALTIFPQGEKLGGSTIYHPENVPVYLTFSEDENILIAVHIFGEGVSTGRDISLADSPSQVVERYGPNFIRFSIKNTGNQDYDMLYGQKDGNTVIFQVRHDRLSKIIVQHQLEN
ncbi:MAG: hypothetical protein GX119_11920 [Syntrophomonadaceae bacterium]|nr:hypothetical protein [Syntrophomonadaceae bacterium]